MTNPGSQRRNLRVISADTLVAGSHFPAHAPAEDVACKSLAVNLSDLAAMGAEPLSVSLVIGNPPDAGSWRRDFLEQYESQCRQYKVVLSDVKTVDGPTQISIQAVGRVPEEQALRRDGARAGDGIYVSGSLGDAGLGLLLALGERDLTSPQAREYCLARLHRPSPRIELGLALRGISRCAIDVSDGLCGDLLHICERSEVGMHIQASLLPLSAALRSHNTPEQAIDLALSAGDDYELCFTAPEQAHDQVMGLADKIGLPVTWIGRVEQDPGLRIRDEHNQDVPLRPAYQHFQFPAAEPAP